MLNKNFSIIRTVDGTVLMWYTNNCVIKFRMQSETNASSSNYFLFSLFLHCLASVMIV